jgi:hypothetical protein
MVSSGNMGRRKRKGNHSSPKNKVVQDLEWYEKMDSPDPDSNKTKINYSKEPYKAHKNNWKKKSYK